MSKKPTTQETQERLIDRLTKAYVAVSFINATAAAAFAFRIIRASVKAAIPGRQTNRNVTPELQRAVKSVADMIRRRK